MIRTRDDLRFYLSEDAKRNGIDNKFKYYLYLLSGVENAHVYRYLRILRKCEYHLNNDNLLHTLFYYYFKVRLSQLGLKYGIRISPNVCGYGLRIMHLAGGGGIFINADKLGNYCGINAGVLLGNKNGNDSRPIIGDYVAFGPGVKVIGKVSIGNNVFIAANAVVVKDVPSDVIVAGVPAAIIKKNTLTNRSNINHE